MSRKLRVYSVQALGYNVFIWLLQNLLDGSRVQFTARDLKPPAAASAMRKRSWGSEIAVFTLQLQPKSYPMPGFL